MKKRLVSSALEPGRVYVLTNYTVRNNDPDKKPEKEYLAAASNGKHDVTADYWMLFQQHLAELINGPHLSLTITHEDRDWLNRLHEYMTGQSEDDPRNDAPKYEVTPEK